MTRDILKEMVSYTAGVMDGSIEHERDEVGRLQEDACWDPVGKWFETALSGL